MSTTQAGGREGGSVKLKGKSQTQETTQNFGLGKTYLP